MKDKLLNLIEEKYPDCIFMRDRDFMVYHDIEKNSGSEYTLKWVNDIHLYLDLLVMLIEHKENLHEDFVNTFKNKRILEVGCGAFPLFDLLYRHSPKMIAGTDTHDELCDNDRQIRIFNVKRDDHVRRLQRHRFDIIYSFRVFQEDVKMQDPDRWLRFYAGLLAPGGRMIHCTSNSRPNIYIDALGKIRYKVLSYDDSTNGHYFVKRRF